MFYYVYDSLAIRLHGSGGTVHTGRLPAGPCANLIYPAHPRPRPPQALLRARAD